MDKRKVFECLLNQFETDEMRNYCADMIEKNSGLYLYDSEQHQFQISQQNSVPATRSDLSYSHVRRDHELCSWAGICTEQN